MSKTDTMRQFCLRFLSMHLLDWLDSDLIDDHVCLHDKISLKHVLCCYYNDFCALKYVLFLWYDSDSPVTAKGTFLY